MPNLSLLVSPTWCAGGDRSLRHACSLPGMHSCSKIGYTVTLHLVSQLYRRSPRTMSSLLQSSRCS